MMRTTLLALALIALSPAAAQTPARIPYLFGPEPSRCVGRGLEACLRGIGSLLDVNWEMVTPQIKRLSERDVDGKYVVTSNRSIDLSAKAPDDRLAQRQMIIVHIAGDKTVSSIYMSLDSFLEYAKTEEEFKRTHVADFLRPIISPSCFGETDLDLYRFLKNNVLDHLGEIKRTTSSGDSGYSVSYGRSAPSVEVCGLRLQFSTFAGHSTESMTVDNPHGSSAGTYLMIEPAPRK